MADIPFPVTPEEKSNSLKKKILDYVRSARSVHLPLPHIPSRKPGVPTPKLAGEAFNTNNIRAKQEFIQKNREANTPEKAHLPTQENMGSRATIIAELIESTKYDNKYGQIVSELVEDQIRPEVLFLGSVFALQSFLYFIVSGVSFGISLWIAYTMLKHDAPAFLYLKYYPSIAVLSVVTSIFAWISRYMSFKIQDSSHRSWIVAIITLPIMNLTTAFALPFMALPLVKMASFFASTLDKPIILPPLDQWTLIQYFSLFLLFALTLIPLIKNRHVFRQKNKPLEDSPKTSLMILFFLFCFPILAVMSYGFVKANTTDFGYAAVSELATYHVYKAEQTPTSTRVLSSNFSPDERLANRYDGVQVIYDVPLTTFIKNGIRSPITVTQAEIKGDFDLKKYAMSQNRDADTMAEPVSIPLSVNQTGYVTHFDGGTTLWLLTTDNILIKLTSLSADSGELITLAESLK